MAHKEKPQAEAPSPLLDGPLSSEGREAVVEALPPGYFEVDFDPVAFELSRLPLHQARSARDLEDAAEERTRVFEASKPSTLPFPPFYCASLTEATIYKSPIHG
jgi:hypothetical protein